MLARIDIPVIINLLLLWPIQISMGRPDNINVFLWNGKCSFLRHTELNSWFSVMTIDEVTLNRPKIATGFSVICWFSRLRLFRFALKFSTEIFAPYRLFPPWSGHSEFVVSPWQFCCTICDWEYEFIIFLTDQHFFCFDSSRVNIWCVPTFPNLPRFLSRYLFSKVLSASRSWPRKIPGRTFLSNWRILDWSFGEDGWYWTIAPKWIIGPLHGSPNRLSHGVFPYARSTIFHPGLTVAMLLTYLPSLVGRLFRRCHLSRIDEVLKCGDSMIKSHMLSKFHRVVRTYKLSVLATVARILISFFPSYVKICFARIRLNSLSGKILYRDSVPVIVSRFTSLIEDVVISRCQVTKLFCTR